MISNRLLRALAIGLALGAGALLIDRLVQQAYGRFQADTKEQVARAAYGHALAAYHSGKLDAALAGFQTALHGTRDPQLAQRARRSLEATELTLGDHLLATDPYGATRCYKAAFWLDPSVPDTHARLAVAAERMGRFDEAAREWRRCQELDPEGLRVPEARQRLAAAYLQMAGTASALHNDPQALEDRRLAAAADPSLLPPAPNPSLAAPAPTPTPAPPAPPSQNDAEQLLERLLVQ